MVFIDLEKAYDKVPREVLWWVLEKSRVHLRYIKVIKDMYDGVVTSVRTAGGYMAEFPIRIGLHQGSALSPYLFTIVVDEIHLPVSVTPYLLSLCIVHAPSSTVIWTANRGTPVSESSKPSLTVDGLAIAAEPGHVVWSNPKLSSKVAALGLLDTGNLILVDQRNVSLWQSFDYPTDILVLGQRLLVGKSLVSWRSTDDL
ncbi:G-type lectin S-receptor-like serine/threonine-protein kinase [Morus notabilis]|uniref:G-type lectin S-receptor-like serine/threonine-protein kinase n=1 Tax=Morus notabilis TaxID=981085 RepID=W9S6L6_9ROSA|nr:G-type lectin S-receptor-like serine/threonine-protein kinase [Morus notabilis]